MIFGHCKGGVRGGSKDIGRNWRRIREQRWRGNHDHFFSSIVTLCKICHCLVRSRLLPLQSYNPCTAVTKEERQTKLTAKAKCQRQLGAIRDNWPSFKSSPHKCFPMTASIISVAVTVSLCCRHLQTPWRMPPVQVWVPPQTLPKETWFPCFQVSFGREFLSFPFLTNVSRPQDSRNTCKTSTSQIH